MRRTILSIPIEVESDQRPAEWRVTAGGVVTLVRSVGESRRVTGEELLDALMAARTPDGVLDFLNRYGNFGRFPRPLTIADVLEWEKLIGEALSGKHNVESLIRKGFDRLKVARLFLGTPAVQTPLKFRPDGTTEPSAYNIITLSVALNERTPVARVVTYSKALDAILATVTLKILDGERRNWCKECGDPISIRTRGFKAQFCRGTNCYKKFWYRTEGKERRKTKKGRRKVTQK